MNKAISLLLVVGGVWSEVEAKKLEERVRERLIAKVYTEAVMDYISAKFSIPKNELVVVYEPRIAHGLSPDLVLVHNDVWFVIEFKTRPSLMRDVEQLARYMKAIEEYVRPKRVIPIMAYVYNKPGMPLDKYVHGIKPIVILLLRGGTYHVLYENL